MDIITLKDDTSEVVISPDLGGSVLAFNVDIDGTRRAILRDANKANSVHDSCCFPLVPFSNRIRAGQFDWLDKTIQLPLNHLPEKHSIHGHGWQEEWQVASTTVNTVVLKYHHKANEWPCSYVAEQTFTLAQGQLKISLSVTNIGDSDMPFGLGLHPYFTRTQLSSLKTNSAHMWAVDNESMPTIIKQAPTSLLSDAGMLINQNTLDNALINFQQQAEIIWPEWGVKADISSSDNCQFLVIYSPENEDYFCVEPVTHCTDAINLEAQGNENTGIKILKPNEKADMWMKVTTSSLT